MHGDRCGFQFPHAASEGGNWKGVDIFGQCHFGVSSRLKSCYIMLYLQIWSPFYNICWFTAVNMSITGSSVLNIPHPSTVPRTVRAWNGDETVKRTATTSREDKLRVDGFNLCQIRFLNWDCHHIFLDGRLIKTEITSFSGLNLLFYLFSFPRSTYSRTIIDEWLVPLVFIEPIWYLAGRHPQWIHSLSKSRKTGPPIVLFPNLGIHPRISWYVWDGY